MADEEDHNENEGLPLGHSSLNDNGGEFLLEEHFALFGETTTTTEVFGRMEQPGVGGRSRSTFRAGGKWVIDGISVEETFKGGPVCLNMLARSASGVTSYQHNFLVDCATFFKKKYPDNWEEALRWVNMQVLRPPGDGQKLQDLIKTVRDKSYNPRCHDEPMCSHCHARACRLEPYGVGGGAAAIGLDMGLTIMNSSPTIYFVGQGHTRMRISPDDLLKVDRYRVKCMERNVDFPGAISHKEWLEVVKMNKEGANIVEPSTLYRKDVEQMEAIEKYFAAHIPNMVRAKGDEYLSGKCGDFVRIRLKEEKIYFKWDKLKFWVEKALNARRKEIDMLREFVDRESDFIGRDEMRGWFRSSWSFKFSAFEGGLVHEWLHPDEPQEDGNVE